MNILAASSHFIDWVAGGKYEVILLRIFHFLFALLQGRRFDRKQASMGICFVFLYTLPPFGNLNGVSANIFLMKSYMV